MSNKVNTNRRTPNQNRLVERGLGGLAGANKPKPVDKNPKKINK